ncbi:hypothetical protein GCM10010317_085370 [Streptomyces mirabilis]|nr:hypothetical protein GCM10010317_085370 [Streptomyces mirabilis]
MGGVGFAAAGRWGPYGPVQRPVQKGPAKDLYKNAQASRNPRATLTGDCARAPGSRMVTLTYPRRPVVHP